MQSPNKSALLRLLTTTTTTTTTTTNNNDNNDNHNDNDNNNNNDRSVRTPALATPASDSVIIILCMCICIYICTYIYIYIYIYIERERDPALHVDTRDIARAAPLRNRLGRVEGMAVRAAHDPGVIMRGAGRCDLDRRRPLTPPHPSLFCLFVCRFSARDS